MTSYHEPVTWRNA